jgi:hypothetical protein
VGNDPRSPDAQRRGLLAKIHIAKKQMRVDDETYHTFLKMNFGVASARALDLSKLEWIVNHFESCGWIARRASGKPTEVLALRDRVSGLALKMPGGPARFRGLSRAICGVDSPVWCSDPAKLKRLLAVCAKIIAQEAGRRQGGNPDEET